MVALFIGDSMKKQRINYLGVDRLDIQEELVFNGQTINLTNTGGSGVQYYPLTTAYTDENSTLAQNITEWNFEAEAGKTYRLTYYTRMTALPVDPEATVYGPTYPDFRFFFDTSDFGAGAKLTAADSTGYVYDKDAYEKNLSNADVGSPSPYSVFTIDYNQSPALYFNFLEVMFKPDVTGTLKMMVQNSDETERVYVCTLSTTFSYMEVTELPF